MTQEAQTNLQNNKQLSQEEKEKKHQRAVALMNTILQFNVQADKGTTLGDLQTLTYVVTRQLEEEGLSLPITRFTESPIGPISFTVEKCFKDYKQDFIDQYAPCSLRPGKTLFYNKDSKVYEAIQKAYDNAYSQGIGHLRESLRHSEDAEEYFTNGDDSEYRMVLDKKSFKHRLKRYGID